jgi:murein DD-endopeptidase MepM/ murein hydrolase activator NlpD
MRPWPRLPVFVATAFSALLAAGSSTPSSLPRLPAPVPDTASAAVMQVTIDGERWLRATQAALDEPAEIVMPFAQSRELGVAEAAAYEFAASGGQTLEITLDRTGAEVGGPIYVEVFRVVDVLGQALHERLTALRPGASSVKTRLPSDGTYHVLVQTGASSTADYRLMLELGAALPFPVVGAKAASIRGLFGASRDSGRRHHAGVDIFVQRLTPVLAVAAGRVMPARDALGGNTVWLNTAGTSYYYAHLDRVAVREQQQVKVGDVLGYVGNTGNAGGTPSHLHFGVYRWGREPVDPLPLLLGQRFQKGTSASADAGE